MRLVLCMILALVPGPAFAAEWFVAPGGTGTGSSADPFGSIQEGIDAAQPGDTVTVAAGTYDEALTSARAGTAAMPIRIRADGDVTVTQSGTVLRAEHAFLEVEGLIFDAQYATDDAVIIDDGASGFVLRDAEVRRTSRDCIDIRDAPNVTIEGSLIHHCLNATGGRTDAHGIVAGAVTNLTIRDTEVHTFSGDAFQVDPGRSAQRWDNVFIEGCRFHLDPLATPENGFPAGTVPGENAVDTKINAGSTGGGRLTIRDTEAWGYRDGLIGNMAAFNIKETVTAVLDGVTVHASEIAFRLRFPATVEVRNAVVFDVGTGIRYEDELVSPRLFNSTFGGAVGQHFQRASSSTTVFDARNNLFLGAMLPTQAPDSSNLAVTDTAFVEAAQHDYRLGPDSPAIDTGETLATVTTDRLGVSRPQGAAYDRGAYEWTPPGADAGTPSDAGTTPDPGGAADAGAAPGGTSGDPSAPSGCGCSGGPGALGSLLFLLGLCVRRARL